MSTDDENPYRAASNIDEPTWIASTPAFSSDRDLPDEEKRTPFWGIVWGIAKISPIVGLILLAKVAQFLFAVKR